MSSFSKNTFPDSLSGIIFALEGIDRSCVLLNGPTGCKFFHSAISDSQRIRQWEFDPLNFPEKLFFGQPRVPCTYLDSRDYVYGSEGKLSEAIAFLRDHVDFDLFAVVNSPGAALIGDDLQRIVREALPGRPAVVMETPGYSSDLCHGYQNALRVAFEQVGIASDGLTSPRVGSSVDGATEAVASLGSSTLTVSGAGTAAADGAANAAISLGAPSVNVLGLSLCQLYHEGDAAELRRLMELCGASVICMPGEDCSLESLGRVSDAALNVVVHPEYGLETARFLEECCGTPFIVCPSPIGFSATEELARKVCEHLGTDPHAALEDSARARGRAYAYISRFNSLTGLPKGVRFSAEGTYSELLAYTSFLKDYLGMVPACLQASTEVSDCWRAALERYLADAGLSDVLGRDIERTESELVLASGETIARVKLAGHPFVGLETALPSMGYLDVVPKTHLGARGALLMVEKVLNAMVY